MGGAQLLKPDINLIFYKDDRIAGRLVQSSSLYIHQWKCINDNFEILAIR